MLWRQVFYPDSPVGVSEGVEALYLRLQSIVRDKLVAWKVREKLGVDYAELVGVLADMRRELEECEGGLRHILPAILIRKP